MRIGVIGAGYVGLVTGTCFAEMGHSVVCLDIDEKKVAGLKEGQIPFHEPGLSELVLRNIKDGRLSFTTSYEEGLKGVKVVFIAVDTPPGEDGQADLSRIFRAAQSIASVMEEGLLVITKSTVPPGTTHKIREYIRDQRGDVSFMVASNPEFLKEGSAINDCMRPDRVVVGVDDEEASALLHEIFSPFMLSNDRFLVLDIVSAELTKYAANAMLATRISFMNQLARLAEVLGADMRQVRKGIGSDSRIGHAFLYPGIGYGGSCFPKDVKALISLSERKGAPLTLLQQVEHVNETQIPWFIDKIRSGLQGIENPVVALWGLAFKPDTDDMREAPSLKVIKALAAEGAQLRLYDPIAIDNTRSLLPDMPTVTFCSSELEAAEGADAVLLVTEWRQFRNVDMDQVKEKMRGNLFFDGRNQYRPEKMAALGFHYKSVGQPYIKPNATISANPSLSS